MTPDRAGLFFSWAKICTLAAAIAGGGFYAGARMTRLEGAIDHLREAAAGAPTASDVTRVREDLQRLRADLGSARVLCPRYALAGQVEVSCALSLQR